MKCVVNCVAMPTNLQIDDRLLNKARKIGGFRTKKDTVNQALTEFLQRRKQRAIGELFGTVDFLADFDHKKLRANRRGFYPTLRFGRLHSEEGTKLQDHIGTRC